MSLDELLALPERFVDYSGPLGPKFRLSWACTSLCNADPVCPYCCTELDRVKQPTSLPRSADECIQGMLQVGEDIGPYYAVTSWGDGMCNDETARVIGAIARRNRVDITCNFIFPKERLRFMPTNGNLNFCVSFHPQLWNSVDEFIDKVGWVVDEGFPVAVIGVVGYPPYMKHMASWVEKMRAAGLTANAMRFGGQFNGRTYPQAYTTQETEMLLSLCAEPDSAREHIDLYLSGSPAGKMCRAGVDYVCVTWDGTAHRCPSLWVDDGVAMGNIFDGITLMKEPKECNAMLCICSDLWSLIEK
jgi:hypothetical protein